MMPLKMYLSFQILKIKGHLYAHTRTLPLGEGFFQLSFLKSSLWCCTGPFVWKGCPGPLYSPGRLPLGLSHYFDIFFLQVWGLPWTLSKIRSPRHRPSASGHCSFSTLTTCNGSFMCVTHRNVHFMKGEVVEPSSTAVCQVPGKAPTLTKCTWNEWAKRESLGNSFLGLYSSSCQTTEAKKKKNCSSYVNLKMEFKCKSIPPFLFKNFFY